MKLALISSLAMAQSLVAADTIGGIIGNDTNFLLLTEALEATGLDLELAAEGPYTLFAPPDDAFRAFAAYSPGTLEVWMAEDPPVTLREVLLYHVAAGNITSKDLVDGAPLEMLQGDTTILSAVPPMIEDASIILADIMATNGVIHVIDFPLAPPNVTILPGLEYVANEAGQFNILLGIIEMLNFTENLYGTDPFTIFAPTDDAFIKINATSEDPSLLLYILTNHVAFGYIDAASLTDGQVLRTLGGSALTVAIDETGVTISGSKVVLPDLRASNGIIHGIDTVILPSSGTYAPAPDTPAPTATGLTPTTAPVGGPTAAPVDAVSSASSVSFHVTILLGMMAMMI